jgi:Domain of unknown function (DUF4917)
MSSTPPDGSLCAWGDVEEAFGEAALLIGNGLSINVWPQFEYETLFVRATNCGLTDDDRTLFDGRSNFEMTLADLNTAIRVNETVGMDAAPVYRHYRNIQLALGKAIREVHVKRSDVPDEILMAIREELLRYEWIFTTSYDLIVYWAMGCGGVWRPFVDGFKYGGRLEFDPERSEVYADETPVYFLHGALHLVVGGSGVTWKLRSRDIQTILDQFGDPIDGDAQARPLLVTEGSDGDKLRAIEGNEYLSYALQTLSAVPLPVVVFGSSLSRHDQHLIDALNENPKRAVAISMTSASMPELLARQADIYRRLKVETLVFFDAGSHPLGARRLCCASEGRR